MKPVRIVAKGVDRYRHWSRQDLRRTYRRLRVEHGLSPWAARSLITDIALSADIRPAAQP